MKKKIIILLFVIFIITTITFYFIFNIFNHEKKYKVDGFNIIQTYNNGVYSFEISNSNINYFVNDFNINKTDKQLINKVYYFSNSNYYCILPLIDNKIKSDIVCMKDKILYNFHDIYKKESDLKKYVNRIKEYNNNKYAIKPKYKNINGIKINSSEDLNISITNYKGVITSYKKIELFSNDVYVNEISAYIDNYYIVADYNNKHEFDTFYIVNLFTNKVTKIKSDNYISFDSYIQGIIDNKIFLYDIDNENQYAIDVYKNEIILVSTQADIKYYNNKWETIRKNKANSKIYFKYDSKGNLFEEYDSVKTTEYYYYLFKRNGISYDMYRVNKNNLNIMHYIANIPTTEIKCNKNYLYYEYKNKVYYYNDTTGIIVVLEDDELEFNETIKYYIY